MIKTFFLKIKVQCCFKGQMKNLQQNIQQVSNCLYHFRYNLPVILILNPNHTHPYGFKEFQVKRQKIIEQINFIQQHHFFYSENCDQPLQNKQPNRLWSSIQNLPPNSDPHLEIRRWSEEYRMGIKTRKIYWWAFGFWSRTGLYDRKFILKRSSGQCRGNSHWYWQGQDKGKWENEVEKWT